jgi:creatine kinase/arginine kinase
MKVEPAGSALFSEASTALVRQFLPPALFERLSGLQTASGFTLARAIRSGQQNPDSSIGIYAGDAECYSLFKEVLDPVIRTYHGLTGVIRHVSDFGKAARQGPGGMDRRRTDFADLPDLDPAHRYILSSRIRVARNLAGFVFTPHISAEDRRQAAQQIRQALATLPAPLQGRYYPMDQLTPEQIGTQAVAGKAFPPGDRFQAAAGITRGFPEARGVYAGHDGNSSVWIHEEDHLRIISVERSGSLSSVFTRLALALDHLTRTLLFAWDPCLGFLNACPSNIGTAMRAGVHIRLPNLERRPDILRQLVRDHGLQIRGTAGEKTAVSGAVFDISNRKRLGIGEIELIHSLHAGIAAIIETEKALSPSGPRYPGP